MCDANPVTTSAKAARDDTWRCCRAFASLLFTVLPALGLCQTITPVSALNFGTFAVTGSGTISISADGVRSTTGGVVLIASNPGAAATFSVYNNTGTSHNCGALTLPSSGSLLQSGDITAVQSSSVGVVARKTTVTVPMGGTLNVVAGQAGGVYSVSNALTVSLSCT